MAENKQLNRTWASLFYELRLRNKIISILVLLILSLGVFYLFYLFIKPGDSVSLLGIFEIQKSAKVEKPVEQPRPTPSPDAQKETAKVKEKQEKESPKEKKEKLGQVIPRQTAPPKIVSGSIPHIKDKIPSPVKRSGVSVLVTRDGHSIDFDFTHEIVTLLKKGGIDVISNPALSERFVNRGAFANAFRGSPEEVVKLGPSNRAEHLILGEFSSEIVTNIEYEGLKTSCAQVEIHVIRSDIGTIEDSFTISGKGAGYTIGNAERNAMGNILKKLPDRLYQSFQPAMK